MVQFIKFLKDDTGATAIEYALIAALVSVVGIVGFTASGNAVIATYEDVVNRFCTSVGGTFAITETGEDSCTFS